MAAFLCTRGGKEPTAEDLAKVEAFAEFLRNAGPAPTRHHQYRQQQDQPEQRMHDKPEDRGEHDQHDHQQD